MTETTRGKIIDAAIRECGFLLDEKAKLQYKRRDLESCVTAVSLAESHIASMEARIAELKSDLDEKGWREVDAKLNAARQAAVISQSQGNQMAYQLANDIQKGLKHV